MLLQRYSYFFFHCVLFGSFIIATIIFINFVEIDIIISRWFFQDNSFYLNDNVLVYFIYKHTSTAVIMIFILLFIAFFYTLFTRSNIFNLRSNAFAFLILAMSFASGIVVNTLIKSYSERARPRAVLEFGGYKTFAPIFKFSGQCQKNCSFVSGHASAGFMIVAFAFLNFSLVWKVIYFLLAVFLGGGVGFIRIMQGGHFLSDVIFSFYFTYLGVAMVYIIFRFFNQLTPKH